MKGTPIGQGLYSKLREKFRQCPNLELNFPFRIVPDASIVMNNQYFETEYKRLRGLTEYLYVISLPASYPSHLPWRNTGHLIQRELHEASCNIRFQGFVTTCSCNHIELTFANAQSFTNSLLETTPVLNTVTAGARIGPEPLKNINVIPEPGSVGLNKFKEMFGHLLARAVIVGIFKISSGESGANENVMFGTKASSLEL